MNFFFEDMHDKFTLLDGPPVTVELLRRFAYSDFATTLRSIYLNLSFEEITPGQAGVHYIDTLYTLVLPSCPDSSHVAHNHRANVFYSHDVVFALEQILPKLFHQGGIHADAENQSYTLRLLNRANLMSNIFAIQNNFGCKVGECKEKAMGPPPYPGPRSN